MLMTFAGSCGPSDKGGARSVCAERVCPRAHPLNKDRKTPLGTTRGHDKAHRPQS
jgi:hypothetical protein